MKKALVFKFKVPDLSNYYLTLFSEYKAALNIYYHMNSGVDIILINREIDTQSIYLDFTYGINAFIEQQLLQINLIIDSFEEKYGTNQVYHILLKNESNLSLVKVISFACGQATKDYYEQVLLQKINPIFKEHINRFSKLLDLNYDKKYSHKKKDVERAGKITLKIDTESKKNKFEKVKEYLADLFFNNEDQILFFHELQNDEITTRKFHLNKLNIRELCDAFHFMNKENILIGNKNEIAKFIFNKFYYRENGNESAIGTVGTIEKYSKGKYLTLIVNRFK